MNPIPLAKLQKRVRSRRDALRKMGVSISKRCVDAGLCQTYVDTILRQKNKKEHRFLPGYVEKLATVLDCDPGYITLEQSRPRV